jgi:hypothetical protein
MPWEGFDWLDSLLFGGLAILLVGFVFVSAVEGWRRWSDNRRIRKHFRNSIIRQNPGFIGAARSALPVSLQLGCPPSLRKFSPSCVGSIRVDFLARSRSTASCITALSPRNG